MNENPRREGGGRGRSEGGGGGKGCKEGQGEGGRALPLNASSRQVLQMSENGFNGNLAVFKGHNPYVRNVAGPPLSC